MVVDKFQRHTAASVEVLLDLKNADNKQCDHNDVHASVFYLKISSYYGHSVKILL